MTFFKLLIFYLSHIIWPYIIIGLFFFYKKKKLPILYYLILIVGLVLAYARFIEPRILIVKTTNITLNKELPQKQLLIAIFSDTHFGVFKNAVSAERIVKRINKIKPDFILMPGDFLYELSINDIHKEVSYFKNFQAPIYAVTGNHDEGAPGPDYGTALIKVLKENNIYVLNNDSKEYSKDVLILGLSDLWAGNYNKTIIEDLNPKKLNILISHNPDMAYSLPPHQNIDFIVSGHTHGGQIRLPFFYKYAIPCEYPFDMGLYENQNSYSVFVTPGTGMVGLPMRFLMPPRIDLLKLQGS